MDHRRLVSLPVPSRRVSQLPYSELTLDKETTYFDVMSQLSEEVKIKGKKRKLTKHTRCHCDPDICQNIHFRKNGWRGCFGQGGNAQSHLESRVRENDVFLFFGSFKNVVKLNDRYTFDKSSRSKHIIFGYLQIGYRFHPNSEKEVPSWMELHPHILHRGSDRNNTIYVATEGLNWDKNLPGWGVFDFNEKLVLTKEGHSKSKWNLPSFFKNVKMTFHSPQSWKKGYFQSAAIGQEFVIDEDSRVTEWAKNLIYTSANRGSLDQLFTKRQK